MNSKIIPSKTINALIPQDQIAGLILAGGRGMRMGCVDKALVLFEGRLLIDWVSEALRAQCAHVYISRQHDQDSVGSFGEVVIDMERDQGPLCGLLSGCKKAKQDGYLFVATAPVDTNVLPPYLIRNLLEVRCPHAMVSDDEGAHPTLSLIDLAFIEKIENAYVRGVRKLMGWSNLENCGHVNVEQNAIENFNQRVNIL